MSVLDPPRDLDEIARIGINLIERRILPAVPLADRTKFIAVDVRSGKYEVRGDSEYTMDVISTRLWLGELFEDDDHPQGLDPPPTP